MSSFNLSSLLAPTSADGFLYNASPLATTTLASAVVLLLVLAFTQLAGAKKQGAAIKQLSEFPLPLANAWAFLTRRFDFVYGGVKRHGDFFQFRMMQHNIVVMVGEQARMTFFGDRSLDFTEGYRVLMGGAPRAADVKRVDGQRDKESDMSWFQKRATSLLRRERLAEGIPQMMADLERRSARWGAAGTFDPFDEIYNLVFQLTMRTVAAKEVADSDAALAKVARLYARVERGTTPRGLLLPWLPDRAKKAREEATTELFTMFSDIIHKRAEKGVRENDALQALLEFGDTKGNIVGFVMGSLFAGIINTGNMSIWLLLLIHANQPWKDRITAEIRSFLSAHAPLLPSAPESLASRLGSISFSAWEDELPLLDAAIRETIRILLASGTALRRNIGDDMLVGGRTVPAGSFLAFPVGSVHFDPAIYPDPHKFDPGRYDEGREEDKKAPWAYLGWGVGRHPCLGMRFAKLEIKMIVALFLAGYEYGLVDGAGRETAVLPEPDRNNIYQARPMTPINIRYTRRSE